MGSAGAGWGTGLSVGAAMTGDGAGGSIAADSGTGPAQARISCWGTGEGGTVAMAIRFTERLGRTTELVISCEGRCASTSSTPELD